MAVKVIAVTALDVTSLAQSILAASQDAQSIAVKVSPDGRTRMVAGGWLRLDSAVQSFAREALKSPSKLSPASKSLCEQVKTESNWTLGNPYASGSACARLQYALLALISQRAKDAVTPKSPARKSRKSPARKSPASVATSQDSQD